jgi:hypothetical protein
MEQTPALAHSNVRGNVILNCTVLRQILHLLDDSYRTECILPSILKEEKNSSSEGYIQRICPCSLTLMKTCILPSILKEVLTGGSESYIQRICLCSLALMNTMHNSISALSTVRLLSIIPYWKCSRMTLRTDNVATHSVKFYYLNKSSFRITEQQTFFPHPTPFKVRQYHLSKVSTVRSSRCCLLKRGTVWQYNEIII